MASRASKASRLLQCLLLGLFALRPEQRVAFLLPRKQVLSQSLAVEDAGAALLELLKKPHVAFPSFLWLH